jgi:hypothetical protein
MTYELINTLTESRTFSSGTAFRRFRVDDATALFYLSLLVHYLYYLENIEWSRTYLRRTRVFNNYDYFRSSQTDLYLLIYLLLGNHESYPYNDEIKRRIRINTGKLNTFIDRISRSHTYTDTYSRQFFYDIERDIRMRDSRYRGLRRNCVLWDDISDQKKKDTIRSLESHIRRISSSSEVLTKISELKKKYD